MKVYEIIHTSPEIKTVYDFLESGVSVGHNYLDNPEAFLNVKNNKGTSTNREVIEATYNATESKKYKGKDARQLLLKVGTKLAIEVDKVNKTGLDTEGLQIVSYDIPAFQASALANLEANENYVTSGKNMARQGTQHQVSVKQIYPDATVWIWCRSLASAANNFEGEIFNISPFIESVSTDMGKNGGSFDIKLPPLVCELNDKQQWVIKKNSLKFYKGSSTQKTDYVAESNIFQGVNGSERSSFLFHNIIGSNDLVFIRFETLQIEEEQRISDTSQLYVPKSNLPNRIYDMIGLVDSNAQDFNATSNDVTINIAGRDLMKLLLEDGTYLFNLELSQGAFGASGSASGKLKGRVTVENEIQFLGLYFNNSIERIVKFVINQLTNISVVPDTLFQAYGDRRNTRYTSDGKADTASTTDNNIIILQGRAKTQIASIRQQAKINLTSSTAEKAKIAEVFRELYKFVKVLRTHLVGPDNTWVTFNYKNERGVTEQIVPNGYPAYFTDNLFGIDGTQYVPQGKPLFLTMLQLVDTMNSKPVHQTIEKKELVSGIWQIIDLVLDVNVTERRPVDASLSSANGALINYFRKVCQDPFVEFFGDTYGDKYHLIIRKPPTDKAGVLSMLKGSVTTEKGTVTKTTSAIVDIEEEDVYRENLRYDDDQVYSWYHFTPQANFLGGEQYSLAYLPAILLDEYAEIWGSKPLQMAHNYLPNITNSTRSNELDVVYKQAIEDYRYLIQSNAHLPFTRKGTIAINGDRRLKVGNLVRYKPTGEIFTIDHVKQDFDCSMNTNERGTVIAVSRGMVEQFIYGIPDPNDPKIILSYFNIVNTTPNLIHKDVTTFQDKRIKIGTEEVEDTSATIDAPPSFIITKDVPIIDKTFVKTQPLVPIIPEKAVGGNSLGQATADFALGAFGSSGIVMRGNTNIHRIDELEFSARGKMIEFINAINAAGYLVYITDAGRDNKQQIALHHANDKNAEPGHSLHQFGKAIDINVINITTKRQLFKGSSKAEWLATGVPQIARRMSINWGGDFVNYPDHVHFSVGVEGSRDKTKTIDVFKTIQVPVHDKVLDVEKTFSNFRVNKPVFNFFLKRLQNATKYRTVTTKSVK
jgi:hypothetical protein